MRQLRALACAAALAAFLASAPAAQAAVSCSYSPGQKRVKVVLTGDSTAIVKRHLQEILVIDKGIGLAQTCAAQPNVTNTDLIEIDARHPFSEANVSLAGGPFAPGAGVESSPEIEFVFDGLGTIHVVGSPGRDHFLLAPRSNRLAGVNMNPLVDTDLDTLILERDLLFGVHGRGGRDVLVAVGRSAGEPVLKGDAGPDRILGGVGDDLLVGGPGADDIRGRRGSEIIGPGAGPDFVRSGRGSDVIDMTPDRRRDRIRCGPGTDAAGFADHRDRFRGCEVVRRGGHRH